MIEAEIKAEAERMVRSKPGLEFASLRLEACRSSRTTNITTNISKLITYQR
jgi:hypothetical protein